MTAAVMSAGLDAGTLGWFGPEQEELLGRGSPG